MDYLPACITTFLNCEYLNYFTHVYHPGITTLKLHFLSSRILLVKNQREKENYFEVMFFLIVEKQERPF